MDIILLNNVAFAANNFLIAGCLRGGLGVISSANANL